MKLTIEIDCNNAAFFPEWSHEARFTLDQFWAIIANVVSGPAVNRGEWKLRDINGNTVGIARITE